jgi:hypothetical protein
MYRHYSCTLGVHTHALAYTSMPTDTQSQTGLHTGAQAQALTDTGHSHTHKEKYVTRRRSEVDGVVLEEASAASRGPGQLQVEVEPQCCVGRVVVGVSGWQGD